MLRRLDVSKDELADQPQIMPILRQNGIHPDRLVEVLRCDDDPDSLTFIKLWDTLTPASRSLAGLEAIALSADLTPRRLWELFQGAALMQSRASISAMIALELPGIIRQTIKQAKKPKGQYDREHVFKFSRMFPTPKGSTTNINLGPEHKALEDGDDDESGDLMPADDVLMRASKAMNPTRSLPKPKAEILEGDVEEDGDDGQDSQD